MAAIACGFTANVDGIAMLDGRLAEQLSSQYSGTKLARPGMFVRSWSEVLDAIVWNMRNGSGGEYIVTESWLLDSIRNMAQWRWTIGGSGLQAACAAAIAGHRALVNLPAWATEYDALLPRDGIQVACASSGRVPVHYILEYNSGTRTNRIILRGTGEFTQSLIAPEFAGLVSASPGEYTALLVSGYNAADSAVEAEGLVQEQIRFLSALPVGPLHVHLELAAAFSAADQLWTVNQFRNHVHSIGCNEDEAAELLGLEEPLLQLPDSRLLDSLEQLHERCRISSLIVHTNQFAACISDRGAAAWAEPLGWGTAFAASRAAVGRLCTAEEMRLIVSGLPAHARGVRLAELAAARPGMCIVPAFAISGLKGATGLGDTFTSGLLLAIRPRRME